MLALNSQAQSQADTIYRTQIAGCERSNALRKESNDRIKQDERERDVLGQFLVSAARARAAAGSPTDRQAATEYLALKSSLNEVHFSRFTILDCNKVVKKP